MEFINQNMQVIIAAAVTLAALLILLLVWRAIRPRVMGRRGQRLGISEYHELDKMRRLVLVRRDDVEHLVLIGGPQDVVIESGISVSGQSSFGGVAPHENAAPGSARSAPRPAVFGDRRPPPLRSVEPGPAPLPRNRDTEPQ